MSLTRTTASDSALLLKTSWGEPDLQGIWTEETDTPLQRSPLLGRDQRAERGTLADVAGAYNDVFTPRKRTGARTSRIVDPPNGRLFALTAEAGKAAAADREFRLRWGRPTAAELACS